MAAKEDSFSPFDDVLLDVDVSQPWAHDQGDSPVYEPSYDTLNKILAVAVERGSVRQSGIFANGIDVWIAHELRRAGFSADEVWPRPTRPRILPRELAMLLESLPPKLRDDLAPRIAGMPAIAPVDAKVLGRAYEKQVDVAIARWDRGPEVLISTKAQLSSFGKNLPNRFEESYGDAGNLRGRYPLAAVGYFFVQRATITRDEPAAFERTIDMVRKLRAAGDVNGYSATALLLVDWTTDEEGAIRTSVIEDVVPDDIAAPQFFTTMIDTVLAASPVTYHVAVREARERRVLPLPENPDS
ncbi:hypothetical protein [Pseudonocardia phyllosphaerae]|uniref:hypothetical protein n=1 Tax=Pseudonocardia phyllosphaerae TaxID=3390502 RepID=UPI00397DF4B0